MTSISQTSQIKPDVKRPVSGIHYPNGDIWCQARQTRIDRSVCIVQGIRQPEKCRGCENESR